MGELLDTADNNDGLLGSLVRHRKITIRGRQVSLDQVMAAYMLGRATVAATRKAHTLWTERRRYTLTVDGDDALFDALMPWVLDNLTESRKRMLLVGYESRRHRSDRYHTVPENSTTAPDASLHVAYDGTRAHHLRIGGERVHVRLERTDPAGVSADGPLRPTEKLVFECASLAGRDAVLELLASTARTIATTASRTARLYTMANWGDWTSRGPLPVRPLASVVTEGDTVARVTGDLARFLESKDRYDRVSAPFHRGYLFHGPPGTGKTSLARALASHFNLDLHYLALGAVKDDKELTSRVADVSGGILLLEDIDVFHATRDRLDDQGVTLSGLLNAIDGTVTPQGLVVIMTTNDRSVLDDAIVRPGRVDLEAELGLIGPHAVARLFGNFYDPLAHRRAEAALPSDLTIAPSAVTSLMLANMDDPSAVIHHLATSHAGADR